MESESITLYDMHCHLGFASNGTACARRAEAEDLHGCSMTVTPQETAADSARFSSFSSVSVGAGLHPWWVEADRWSEQTEQLLALLPEASIIGEVGLDFSGTRKNTADAQRNVLEALCRYLAVHGEGRMVSLHSVRAAGETLDLLERTGALDGCRPVFHWFSGTADELRRATALGCRFSVGPRMLASKKGRAYAGALPAQSLLLETDMPPAKGDSLDFSRWKASLEEAVLTIAVVRSLCDDECRRLLAANSAELLS